MRVPADCINCIVDNANFETWYWMRVPAECMRFGTHMAYLAFDIFTQPRYDNASCAMCDIPYAVPGCIIGIVDNALYVVLHAGYHTWHIWHLIFSLIPDTTMPFVQCVISRMQYQVA